MKLPRPLRLSLLAPLLGCQTETPSGRTNVARPSSAASAAVVANDNRIPGGSLRHGVRELRLEARLAAWRPDADVDSAVTVQTFAEAGGTPRIPGPLLRAVAGAEVRVSVRNSFADSTLVMHGLRAGTIAVDTLQIAPGATREVRFRAGAPGTYVYWGSTSNSSIDDRPWRDSQLTGAIVIDSPSARPDSAERIFVVTVLDVYEDSVHNPAKENIWELAINGKSWPHTERLEYAVGDTVHWRWINGSYLSHPMHLHGFHFRVLAKGNGSNDTVYSAHAERLAVTEFMQSGSTFQMAWVPTRAGRWLMHCHMIPHITPFPERTASTHALELPDGSQHAEKGMAGLVLGITTIDRSGAPSVASVPTRRLRLFAQQARARGDKPIAHGYVLQQGAEPQADSVEIPGSPVILARGQTAAITVINRMHEATAVHWHGMELESMYDGVPGWSRTGSSLAPLVAPGDSFTAVFTPPRAGTFIYHTHMDEGAQLRTGMYGVLLVLEPGERYDATTDLVFMIGEVVNGDSVLPALNGRAMPRPMTLHAGTRYRLRFVNILSVEAVRVTLSTDSRPTTWRPLAKDGANLSDLVRVETAAQLLGFGVGETYDFEWTPTRPTVGVLEVHLRTGVLRQTIRVGL